MTDKTEAETPRTDAALTRINMETVVSASFARRLETELSEMRRERDDMQKALDANWVTHQRVVKAEQSLARARACIREIISEDCPMPIGDDHTITGCIKNGECGCCWNNHADAIKDAGEGDKS